ncbi:MAG: hypothetical protein KTR19_00845 [Hyphomicrobiales bacterium]|nr:hypothetical protein [Hyphomicrobiales bacterium]
MSSVIRIGLGAALLLSSVPAAIAASEETPVSNEYIQGSAEAAVETPEATVLEERIENNVTAASVTIDTPADITLAAPQSRKASVNHAGLWCDNTDAYGGHSPDTLWGMRAFWDNQASRGN